MCIPQYGNISARTYLQLPLQQWAAGNVYLLVLLGNFANTDSIRQAKGEPGQALVPTLTLETNKQTS